MNSRRLVGSLAATFLSGAMGLGAQAPDAAAGQAFTVTGCVQKETAVLKRSAAVGDIGMTDEFVLTHSKLGSSSTAEPQPETKPAAGEPVGTSGAASNFGKVYRVTGDKENELKPYVGQRVEIAGSFKHETDAKAELASKGAGGQTGELTPANTPEITISSIRPVSGTCAPGVHP
jgi:hypothetical protein